MKNKNSIIITIIIAFTLIISLLIIKHTYEHRSVNYSNRTLSVTGSAFVEFEADMLSYDIAITRESKERIVGINEVNADREKLAQLMEKLKITPQEFNFSTVRQDELEERRYITLKKEKGEYLDYYYEKIGYETRFSIKIRTKRFEIIESLPNEIQNTLGKDVALNVETPKYFFSGLEGLKLDLIDKATANAYKRAEIISENAHGKLGDLIKSRLGVLQITSRYSGSNSYSWDGAFETFSPQKRAFVTVKLEYKLK